MARYYLDYGTKTAKRKGGKAPNALMIAPENGMVRPGIYEGLAAVFDHENSDVACTGISREYLRDCCKRTSRTIAHAMHSRLAERDQD